MLNLFEAIRSDPSFKRFEIGDVLFAEYTCPIGEERLGLFAPTDYVVHVISGKKTWHTADAMWSATAGETLFFKKGAAIVEQYFDAEFCLLMFFIPDRLIRETVRDLAAKLGPDPYHGGAFQSAILVQHDMAVSAFLQSMRAYFSGHEMPSEPLLQLKLKELIVGLLTGGSNPQLASYFRAIQHRDAPSVAEIMETNFRFNLSLDEFAQLCHRSLSSFKRDFQRHFSEPPGKWLLHRRLDHAAGLLRSTTLPVTEIVFESGFEDVSHFSRAFKRRFQASPTAYREASHRSI